MLGRVQRIANCGQRRHLIGIQLERRLPRMARFMRSLGSHSLDRGDDEAFLAQHVERRDRATGLRRELLGRERSLARGEQSQQFRLLGRKLQLLGSLRRIRRRSQECHIATARIVPNARRHNRLQYLAPRTQIIVGHPSRKPQHGGRQQRPAIEQRGDRLQLPPARRLHRHIDAIPDDAPIAPPQRHPHPPARFQRSLRPRVADHLRRDRVIELASRARPASRPSPPAPWPHHPIPTAPARYRRVIAEWRTWTRRNWDWGTRVLGTEY